MFLIVIAWLAAGTGMAALGYKLNGRSGLTSSVVAYVLSGLTLAALLAFASQNMSYRVPF